MQHTYLQAWLGEKKCASYLYDFSHFFSHLKSLVAKTDSKFFHSWKAINKKSCKTHKAGTFFLSDQRLKIGVVAQATRTRQQLAPSYI